MDGLFDVPYFHSCSLCTHKSNSKCLKSARYCFPTFYMAHSLSILCQICSLYSACEKKKEEEEATKRCNKILTLRKQTSGNLKHNPSFIFEPFQALWSLRPAAPGCQRGIKPPKAFPKALLKITTLLLFGSWISRGDNSAQTSGNLLAPSFFSFLFFFCHETSLCFNSLSFIVKMMRTSRGLRPLKAISLPP